MPKEKTILKKNVILEGKPVSEEKPMWEGKSALEEIRISVRSLVEFVLRHGDIDNRHKASPDNAMQEGSRIHRMIQRRMGAGYRAEVSLKYIQGNSRYLLVVEGRADGIFCEDGKVTIDEIKGTYRELARMKGPAPLHIAQAKCYAYIYGLQEKIPNLRIRMTYCNMPSEEIRYFYQEHTFEELEEWFLGLIHSYRRWSDYAWEWGRLRQSSIEGLPFPFPYRQGQKELAADVYRTIFHGRKLFLEAPTGVGKTISTIYPAIQAMGKGMGEKLFYLTAKTITRTVADDTLALLRKKGLRFKSVILTAKEKICFMEETECNPERCPYARGHYDRINEAVFDLLTARESFSRDAVEEYAQKHQVCPFEMCLDMSLFSDAVICDYNYLFDPHAYLRRYFNDDTGRKYLFLIDEAHNLLERGREMYSAVLWKEQFMELCRELKQTLLSETSKKRIKTGIRGQMDLKITDFMTQGSLLEKKEDIIDQLSSKSLSGLHGGKSVLVKEGYGEKLIYHLEKCNKELLTLKREGGQCQVVEDIDAFSQPLVRLHAVLDDYLSEQDDDLPVRKSLLNFYFEVSHFLAIYELLDENYVKYTYLEENGCFLIKLFCVNPRENLKSCMQRGRSSVLFSATFLPVQYYKKLLGGDEEDYEVYARSVFDPARKGLFIANDVTSKYSRRSEEEFFKLARYIEEIAGRKDGNYMVFCPSYAFMRTLYETYSQNFGAKNRECILQNEAMSEADREEFLARYTNREKEDRQGALIGFCVLGGIFGEGIDLKNDSLIGAVIAGTGIPQVCFERELLKEYFDGQGENGFDYSYRYPGMNKVLQAAGRVIRTMEDVGVVALLDHRFLHSAYQRMFPREWEQYEIVSVDTVGESVERFWNRTT